MLQALLEHWWRPVANDDEADGQGDSPSTGSNTHTRGGNEYFSVPGHTPVILRLIYNEDLKLFSCTQWYISFKYEFFLITVK